jgi:hypothetical protein
MGVLIATLAIALLSWYYFGQKVASVAASVSGALFLLAAIAPSLKWHAYGVVAVGVVAICTIGARRPPESRTNAAKAVFFARRGVAWARKRLGL